jgi:excisionase family DNA binding protein
MNELENISFATILNAFRGIIREEVQSVLEEEQERKKPMKYYTRKEVCELAHITLPTLWRRVNEGKITPTTNGRRVLFAETEIQRYLQNGK